GAPHSWFAEAANLTSITVRCQKPPGGTSHLGAIGSYSRVPCGVTRNHVATQAVADNSFIFIIWRPRRSPEWAAPAVLCAILGVYRPRHSPSKYCLYLEASSDGMRMPVSGGMR